MTCEIKHYDCLEQSDCEHCREDRALRAMAVDLLTRASIPATEPDITILADDLALVRYEPRIDGTFKKDYSVRELFRARIGGNLAGYMACIRPKGAK